MQSNSNRKLRRKMLVLSMLLLGLMMVSLERAPTVSAKTCAEANNDFYEALGIFDDAFSLYYYNDPTSCAQECSNAPPQEYPACVSDCEQTRRTNLDQAQIGILEAGSEIGNCTNPEPDYCSIAQARDDECIANYNYLEYEDLDQRLDIFTAYSACRDASGVDQCQ